MKKIDIRFDYEEKYPDVVPSYLGTVCPFCGSRKSYIVVTSKYFLCTNCETSAHVDNFNAEIKTINYNPHQQRKIKNQADNNPLLSKLADKLERVINQLAYGGINISKRLEAIAEDLKKINGNLLEVKLRP